MIPGDKGQNVVLVCKIGHLNLEPAKREQVAKRIANIRLTKVRITAGGQHEQRIGKDL